MIIGAWNAPFDISLLIGKWNKRKPPIFPAWWQSQHWRGLSPNICFPTQLTTGRNHRSKLSKMCTENRVGQA
jgi:hypothetical protein